MYIYTDYMRVREFMYVRRRKVVDLSMSQLLYEKFHWFTYNE